MHNQFEVTISPTFSSQTPLFKHTRAISLTEHQHSHSQSVTFPKIQYREVMKQQQPNHLPPFPPRVSRFSFVPQILLTEAQNQAVAQQSSCLPVYHQRYSSLQPITVHLQTQSQHLSPLARQYTVFQLKPQHSGNVSSSIRRSVSPELKTSYTKAINPCFNQISSSQTPYQRQNNNYLKIKIQENQQLSRVTPNQFLQLAPDCQIKPQTSQNQHSPLIQQRQITLLKSTQIIKDTKSTPPKTTFLHRPQQINSNSPTQVRTVEQESSTLSFNNIDWYARKPNITPPKLPHMQVSPIRQISPIYRVNHTTSPIPQKVKPFPIIHSTQTKGRYFIEKFNQLTDALTSEIRVQKTAPVILSSTTPCFSASKYPSLQLQIMHESTPASTISVKNFAGQQNRPVEISRSTYNNTQLFQPKLANVNNDIMGNNNIRGSETKQNISKVSHETDEVSQELSKIIARYTSSNRESVLQENLHNRSNSSSQNYLTQFNYSSANLELRGHQKCDALDDQSSITQFKEVIGEQQERGKVDYFPKLEIMNDKSTNNTREIEIIQALKDIDRHENDHVALGMAFNTSSSSSNSFIQQQQCQNMNTNNLPSDCKAQILKYTPEKSLGYLQQSGKASVNYQQVLEKIDILTDKRLCQSPSRIDCKTSETASYEIVELSFTEDELVQSFSSRPVRLESPFSSLLPMRREKEESNYFFKQQNNSQCESSKVISDEESVCEVDIDQEQKPFESDELPADDQLNIQQVGDSIILMPTDKASVVSQSQFINNQKQPITIEQPSFIPALEFNNEKGQLSQRKSVEDPQVIQKNEKFLINEIIVNKKQNLDLNSTQSACSLINKQFNEILINNQENQSRKPPICMKFNIPSEIVELKKYNELFCFDNGHFAVSTTGVIQTLVNFDDSCEYRSSYTDQNQTKILQTVQQISTVDNFKIPQEIVLNQGKNNFTNNNQFEKNILLEKQYLESSFNRTREHRDTLEQLQHLRKQAAEGLSATNKHLLETKYNLPNQNRSNQNLIELPIKNDEKLIILSKKFKSSPQNLQTPRLKEVQAGQDQYSTVSTFKVGSENISNIQVSPIEESHLAYQSRVSQKEDNSSFNNSQFEDPWSCQENKEYLEKTSDATLLSEFFHAQRNQYHKGIREKGNNNSYLVQENTASLQHEEIEISSSINILTPQVQSEQQSNLIDDRQLVFQNIGHQQAVTFSQSLSMNEYLRRKQEIIQQYCESSQSFQNISSKLHFKIPIKSIQDQKEPTHNQVLRNGQCEDINLEKTKEEGFEPTNQLFSREKSFSALNEQREIISRYLRDSVVAKKQRKKMYKELKSIVFQNLQYPIIILLMKEAKSAINYIEMQLTDFDMKSFAAKITTELHQYCIFYPQLITQGFEKLDLTFQRINQELVIYRNQIAQRQQAK